VLAAVRRAPTPPRWARNHENRSIRTVPPAPPPRQRARRLRGRGIAGGEQRLRARQVLPLEAHEPGFARCEPRRFVRRGGEAEAGSPVELVT
jgi:hypothetical protein